MFVKDLKIEDVKIGLRVWNKKKTQQGTIDEMGYEYEDDCHITWDDGTESLQQDEVLEIEVVENTWKCESCGEIVSNDNVIANGYGHTIVVYEDDDYKEAVCGPLERVVLVGRIW